ncbi:hypothetical protein [Algicola sagamiensis]|uniref:hypothetical protein n=1 Tax=Algicola sagamiensis TaxID=163869 RepID=UPI000381B49A|nr:hypothetical protein [Algicola sagamiensis]
MQNPEINILFIGLLVLTVLILLMIVRHFKQGVSLSPPKIRSIYCSNQYISSLVSLIEDALETDQQMLEVDLDIDKVSEKHIRWKNDANKKIKEYKNFLGNSQV